MLSDDYSKGDTLQFLVRRIHLCDIMDDWVLQNRECDVRVRRAKTPGCVVIETQDVVFVSRMISRYPDIKVTIKK